MNNETFFQSKTLDLCCGMGGLSHGFHENGFDVTGVDINEDAGATYTFNKIGQFFSKDLMRRRFGGQYSIVIGGPPCEPWSCLNLSKRKENHPKYKCINAFTREILSIQPIILVMENVPAIQKDPLFAKNVEKIQKKYRVVTQVVDYSEYGAAFARRRFFIVGARKDTKINPITIINGLEKKKAKTVRKAISSLKNKEWNKSTDHVWPKVKTINKYLHYYETGKYGWRILEWNKPSRSFGNITKTYILHPDSFKDGKEPRPISVREALRIVGFPDEYSFPDSINMRDKYEMIADAVSPVFSFNLAKAIKETLLNS